MQNYYVPSRSLRSSDSNLLSVPRVRTCFDSRSFVVAAHTIWNTLPLDIRNSPSICCFRRHLKTFFYNVSFRPSYHTTCASDSVGFCRWHCAQYTFIYLLTYLLTKCFCSWGSASPSGPSPRTPFLLLASSLQPPTVTLGASGVHPKTHSWA